VPPFSGFDPAGLRNRRRGDQADPGRAKGRLAIVARMGQVNHYECLSARRYQGLEALCLSSSDPAAGARRFPEPRQP